MYYLKVRSHFCAAHNLEGYKGSCANVHGHTWSYEVVFKSGELDHMRMVVDFTVVKGVLKELEDKYLDHRYLNESLNFQLPTAEFLANYIYDYLASLFFNKKGFTPLLYEVTVWESNDCCVTRRNDYVL